MNSPQPNILNQVSIPAEWDKQSCIWTAWPARKDLWQDALDKTRHEVALLIQQLSQAGQVKVLVMGSEARSSAEQSLPFSNVQLLEGNYGDIWLRDTGPIFALVNNSKTALKFRFNGWGEKYVLDHDNTVSEQIALLSNTPARTIDFIIEGGAIEHDGQGTFITTEQCLLNHNRNKELNKHQIEKILQDELGAKKIIWLKEGLINDHTDGHIDNLARFVAPGHVLCQKPVNEQDPNYEILNNILEELSNQNLKISTIPSPGQILDDENNLLSASHMNFIIFNSVVVMPKYEEHYSQIALSELQKIFSDRKVVASQSNNLLLGGGSFHCITQQESTPASGGHPAPR